MSIVEITMDITPDQDPIDRNEALRLLNMMYEPEHVGGIVTEKGKTIVLCMKVIESIPTMMHILYKEGGKD